MDAPNTRWGGSEIGEFLKLKCWENANIISLITEIPTALETQKISVFFAYAIKISSKKINPKLSQIFEIYQIEKLNKKWNSLRC